MSTEQVCDYTALPYIPDGESLGNLQKQGGNLRRLGLGRWLAQTPWLYLNLVPVRMPEPGPAPARVRGEQGRGIKLQFENVEISVKFENTQDASAASALAFSAFSPG